MPGKKSSDFEGMMDCSSHGCCRPSDSYGKKILYTLIGILLVYGIVFLGTVIRNNMQKFYFIGRAEMSEHTITIDAQGKVSVRPDIAVTTMGMISEATTVADAQKKNTDVMNNLITKLKQLGIESKDIQTTNYNVYPQYSYRDNDQVLKGYQVSQNVTVKIRNLDNANKVLALAGEVGANNVSGLSFTVDDPEQFKNEARKQALEKVQEKAFALSKSLGVKVVGVVNYAESEGGYGYGGPLKALDSGLGGMGGAAPVVESGSTEVVLNVSVTYEIQ